MKFHIFSFKMYELWPILKYVHYAQQRGNTLPKNEVSQFFAHVSLELQGKSECIPYKKLLTTAGQIKCITALYKPFQVRKLNTVHRCVIITIECCLMKTKCKTSSKATLSLAISSTKNNWLNMNNMANFLPSLSEFYQLIQNLPSE